MRVRNEHRSLSSTEPEMETMSQPQQLHVVLGAGQVGPLLARQLAVAGHRVRMVSRSRPRQVEGVEWMPGDLSDVDVARQVIAGASVVYNCANPMRYDQWETLLPPLARAVQAAVSGSGARLVVLDNLYMYGAADGGVIRDDTPDKPQSRKGALRAKLADELFDAQARGELQVSVGRAADFFGAESARSATFHPLFFKRLARGKASPVLGDPDLTHAHAYMPDVARALFLLGTQPRHRERAWLLPATWNGSVRGLFEQFGHAAGRSVKPLRVPAWLWPALGLFDAELTAIPEMLHQWNAPMMIDDSTFRRQFDMEPTPIAQAVRETLAAHGVACADADADATAAQPTAA
jgi:nucleoside-diphosphate-sugar epimerase